VHDKNARQFGGTASGLANVRCEDRLGQYLSVAEESVRSLELSVVESLRKAFTRSISDAVSESAQPPI
jgi:hypothetical protein